MNCLSKRLVFALIAFCAVLPELTRAADVAPVPALTPQEVLGWMAPLRIEDGRLDIDWTAVGILSAKTAGLKTEGGKAMIEIASDVHFNVAVPNAQNPGAATELALILHVEGGSATARPFGTAQNPGEIPITANIQEKSAEGGLRGYLRARGLPVLDGAAFDIAEMKLNLDSSTCLAIYELTRKSREFNLRFKEERVLKFELTISRSRNVTLIHFENLDSSGGFNLTQKPGGEVELSFDKGATKSFIRAESLRQLVQENTAETQLNFFRPLADVGVQFALSPDLPVVMAAATSGFSEPLPEIASKADALILQIRSAASPAERARAVTELTRFYPQAIYHIFQAAERETDPDQKAALKRVIAAHPGIIRAVPFALERKLHEDRTYLLDLFERAPLFKAGARARLAALLGKDYGDNPDLWKK